MLVELRRGSQGKTNAKHPDCFVSGEPFVSVSRAQQVGQALTEAWLQGKVGGQHRVVVQELVDALCCEGLHGKQHMSDTDHPRHKE